MKSTIFFEKKLARINRMSSEINAKIKKMNGNIVELDKEIEVLIGKSIPMSIGKKKLAVTDGKVNLALMIQDLLVAKTRIQKEINRLSKIINDLAIVSDKIFVLANDAKWNRDYQILNNRG